MQMYEKIAIFRPISRFIAKMMQDAMRLFDTEYVRNGTTYIYISFAARAFCAAAPKVWSSLGVHTLSADTFLTFKNWLKTELFLSCYS